MEAENIELKFVESKFLSRRSCTICGGHTEKDYVLVEAEIPGGHRSRLLAVPEGRQCRQQGLHCR